MFDNDGSLVLPEGVFKNVEIYFYPKGKNTHKSAKMEVEQ